MNNPPAFPTQTFHKQAAERDIGISVTDSPGMTLRDYFAGQVLVGTMCQPTADTFSPDKLARYAFKVADAMLAARGQS